MQIISGYNDSANISAMQKFRLYHLNRPAVKKWRATRHNKKFFLDNVDQWVIKNYENQSITAVDCAGWYLNDFGLQTTCVEGDELSKIYWPTVHIEFDIFWHRPTYVNGKDPVLFKNPWFLKYVKFEPFLNFLQIWTTSQMILNFDPIYVQHNHLKVDLKNLVQDSSNLQIEVIQQNLWTVTR